jgi:hypothetical protein
VVGSIPSDSTHSLSVPRSGQCLSGHRCMFFVYSFLSINLVIHSGSFFLALVILDGTCFSAKSFVLARLLDLCFGHYSFPSCHFRAYIIYRESFRVLLYCVGLSSIPLVPKGRFEVFGGAVWTSSFIRS